MKKFSPSFFFLCSALTCVPVAALSSVDLGSIAFVGDSITQGGGEANQLSYRYPLWKIFVDNGAEWNPVGSMTIFNNGSETGATTGYRGETFNNRSEGHYGWRTSDYLTGPVGRSANSGSGTVYDWLKNSDYYPEGTPDTVTYLLGVNDLSFAVSIDDVASRSKQILDLYKSVNSDVNIYVFGLLPSAQASWGNVPSVTPAERIAEYNTTIKAQIENGEWGTNVTYHDISAGFDPTSGVHTSDSLHPNAQGALIVAGNIARVLGLEQRTVGKTRVDSGALNFQTSFSKSGDSGVSVSVNTGGASVGTMTIGKGSENWTLNSDGNIEISANKTESYIKYDYSPESGKHEFTLDVSFRMKDTEDNSNRLSIWCGNGEVVGLLYVEENAVLWGTTVLYRNHDKSDLFTEDFSTLRMTWIEGNTDQGIEDGFYVWLGDMLIGEALKSNANSSANSSYGNSILFGNTSSSTSAYAEISNIAFDATKAYSPIPEPSAFGMLAGAGAIVIAVARRRRKNG